MGEGVTNPADSPVEGSSVLWAACLKLVLLLGLSYVVGLRWRQQTQRDDVTSDASSNEDNTVSSRGEFPTTSLTGDTGPLLHRSASCGVVSQLESVSEDMEQSTGVPSDPQPDSFFTWDSGGNSGDYSFVHTAVELPKYPDDAITEEERQMLLLYMQSGHPELLLSSNAGMDSTSILGPPPTVDALMCDQTGVRGFLETIVEENSDDLRSTSDCDDASVGWGSWDESDDDRVTVVEMETNDENSTGRPQGGLKRELEDPSCASNPNFSKREKITHSPGYNNISSDSVRQNFINAPESQLDCYDLADKQFRSLSNATSVNNCAPSSSVECTKVAGDKSAELVKVSESSAKNHNNLLLDIKSKVSHSSCENSDFDNLWISANNIDSSNVQKINPWCKNENNFIPSTNDIQSVEFSINNLGESTSSSLLTIGCDDLCLVPSGMSNSDAKYNEEKLMFSDDFKDYFLPTDSRIPPFNRNSKEKLNDVPEIDNVSSDQKVRYFRIGFETEPREIVNNEYYNSPEKSSPTNSETENSGNSDLREETLFSPRDGDIVYGSSWLDGRVMKKPEKTPSTAEARFSTTHSESPPSDNIRESLHLSDQSASDEESKQIPHSLSRWQHHNDLQHVQEATSPLSRWQHQMNLQKSIDSERSSKQTYSDEDSDDGLPPQLKQIYSSFKMKDNKMARIRIKEDKNNNFKRMGLWDNESKVTLPPFITNNTQTESSQSKDNKGIKEEELDDLELDMFSNNKNKSEKLEQKINADSDVDDALNSFNHLDDYSSNSEENSESENSYTVNTVENIEYDNEDFSNPSTPDVPSLKNDTDSPCTIDHLKSENENSCSDNSDSCPLCTDPRFKNSRINDIFSNPTEEKILDNNVQSLLLNTYPKIKTLSQDDKRSETNATEESASPLTSSDSDEGIRTAKDTKKRIKRRSKENSNAELKHDDSGYVEDDEDDDEDDSLEEKDTLDPIQLTPNVSCGKEMDKKVRKSLSTAFYESKSVTDSAVHGDNIPKSFEEFSSHLQNSAVSDAVKDGVINDEKWNIPENLSQFSAWLLDEEMKKISCRDEMEKLIVNDLISLKEQTISKFLKNSLDEKDKIIPEKSKNEDSNENANLEANSSFNEEFSNTSNAVEFKKFEENYATEMNSDSDKTLSDENFEDKVEHSSEELDSEYYSFNLNANVSKINANYSEIDQNQLISLNSLPDVISSAKEVIEVHKENNSVENTLHTKHDLSLPETNKMKSEKVQKIYSESPASTLNNNCSMQGSNNVDSLNERNTETNANENQKSELHSNVDDIETEIQAKVICTTTVVTSEGEPTTNTREGNDSCSAIDNKNDKASLPCEVAPSVEVNKNYYGLDDVSIVNKNTQSSEEGVTLNDILNNDVENETQIKLASLSSNDTFHDLKNNIFNNDKCLESNNISMQINTSDFVCAEPNDEVNIIKKLDNETNHFLNNDINSDKTPVENEFAQEVAPSSEDKFNEFFKISGSEFDPMISELREVKGAYEGFSNEIISPQAKVVSKEVEALKHVSVDCHAYDERASVTRPFVNDNSCCLPPTKDTILSDNSGEKILEEELQNLPVAVSLESNISSAQLADDLEVSTKSNATNLTCKDTVLLLPSHEDKQVSESLSKNKISSDINTFERSSKEQDCSPSNNLYKSKSVIVLQTEDIDDEDISSEADNLKFESLNNSFENNSISKSVNDLESPDIIENSGKNFTKSVNDIDFITSLERSRLSLSDIKSSDDLSILANKSKSREAREKYTRSRSVGRENKEETETYESWSGQSKSTPDLSRCHDQQLNSSVPLSALLSKSVSQRIQDYLGKSTRGSLLNRSLPPNERSRHYRRICVSTETVVERAAKFEARSKSSGRDHSIDSVDSRSGSCPPASMRNGDIFKSVRGYSKPVATVRPTLDTYKNSYENRMAKKSEEDLFELITGYSQATKVTHKPPPVPQSSSTLQQSLRACRLKGKIASARKEFFEKLSQSDLSPKTDSKQSTDVVDIDEDDSCGLRRFSEFRKSAREERARLAQSHPDLGALEAAVRSSRRRIDQLKKRRQKSLPSDAGPRPSSEAGMPGTTVSSSTTKTKDGTLVLPYRRCTGEIAWASCAKRLQEAKSRSESKSQEPLEIVDERRFKRPAERPLLRAHDYENAADEDYEDPGPAISGSDFSRARSMDFLLDNRERAEPPENRLAQRVKSEHELRIERSLQNLTLPDWYTQSKKPEEGFILRRGSEGSAGESRKRWLGFSSSRTPSATSLTTPPSSYSQRSIIIPKRVTPTSGEWRYIGSLVSSRESLTPASPASLSPRDCSSAAFNYGLNSSLSRWSSSRLSTSSAPLTAVSVHRSFRQPYLGWRAAAASSSGGPSRTSPGMSPLNATTPVQGSRPGSPRRGSQDHQYGYGLQQNQITSAATLRPESGETDSGSRISPLALYDNSTNVFFNSNMEVQDFSTPEMRRDRYSYTQSLYSGTVIVSPGTEFKPVPSIAEDTSSTTDDRFSMSKSPQPPPRIWMESSFVGTKKDGKDEVHYPQGRTIRIVPSDSVRSGSGSSVRSSCAPQTTMDTRELIDHLHNFLRGLQNRNQMIRPSSNSAFTPVSSSSNSGFHQNQNSNQTTISSTTTTITTTTTSTTTQDSHGSRSASTNLNLDQRPNLVNYETEPKAYPRSSWRHSSSSSKDISPDNSSTDNELWLSVGEDMGSHSFSRATPDARSSSRSSISPPSPPMRYQQQQKRASEDSTGSARPIFFASSRRGSKGSNYDPRCEPPQQQPHQYPSNVMDSSQNREEQISRKSSSTHSEESGYIRRDSKSGGSNSWKESRTDQESSSASRAEKSSASMEEVLESLLAIPPSNSRSSSPTSPRRSRGQSLQHLYQQQQSSKIFQKPERTRKSVPEVIRSQPTSFKPTAFTTKDTPQKNESSVESSTEAPPDDQGKLFDASFNLPQIPSSTTTTNQPLFPSEEVNNHGSFCRSSSTSPLEDDVNSPTSMEVLVPEGEEQDLSSIIEDDTKLTEDLKTSLDQHLSQPLRQASLHECQHHPRPPLRRQSTLPSCSSNDPLSQPHGEELANLFAGLQPGSYSRGIAEQPLRRPQSLCLVLLHLPCMFCARALAPPPTINSFSHVQPTRETCVSEPVTPTQDSVCSFEPGPCCGDPVIVGNIDQDFCLTNVDSNPGRGPSTHEESGTTPKKKMAATIEGHLKCHRPRCNKSLPAEEARARFRTCPNCYTYYCSRQCRKLHLARHKDHCPQTRISNLCKQVLMKARDDPVSRRHLSLCARRGLLSRGRGAVKLLFLCPEDALDYLVKGWEAAKGQTLYVSRSDLLPQEMGAEVFTQVRNFCDKYNPERKFILLAAITVTNDIAQALDREVVVRGAKMHLSPSLPEDDVQTLILTISKTDPQTGDPIQSTMEERRKGLSGVIEQLSARGVDVEKLYPHTFRKITRFVEENEPFSPISIFPTDQRNGRVFMCIILPWADADIITNISSKGGVSASKSSKKKWML